MYHEYYNLKTNPFHITPDPSFFFPSASHREAFAALLYGLQNRKGFIVMTGEVGSGKTTVLRSFLEAGSSTQLRTLFKGIDTTKIKTVFVFNPDISFRNLLRVIYGELGLTLPKPYRKHIAQQRSSQNQTHAFSEEEAVFELVQHLHTELIREYQAGNHILLIIDEAQNMPVKTLENLRMLSNLETAQDKLVQIFLIGQPELDAVLQKYELRQLKQRIAVRTKITPLRRKETVAYVRYRLQRAGASNRELFSKRALKAVHKYAQGIPRRINTICDNALIAGYANGKKTVGSREIRSAIADIEGGARKHWLIWAGAFAAFVVAASATAWFSPLRSTILRPALDSWQELGQSMGLSSPKALSNASQSKSSPPKPLEELGGDQDSKLFEEDIPFPQGLFPSNKPASPAPVFPDETPQQSQGAGAPKGKESLTKPSTAPARPNRSLDAFPATDFEKRLQAELMQRVPVYAELSKARRMVLVEMAKQVSVSGLLTFRKMLQALEEKDFNEASRQMILSNWEKQVGGTAYELAKTMRTGELEER